MALLVILVFAVGPSVRSCFILGRSGPRQLRVMSWLEVYGW